MQSSWKKSLRRNNMKDKDFNRLVEGVKQFAQIRRNEIRAAKKAGRHVDKTSSRTNGLPMDRSKKTSVA